ncbi:MAG TPA: MBL fold metallo-hydrolase [Longimicrobiaceae bacterium]|jgi:glyoxylase-like metal-dependent hydrolase (beta-lactamase superfamily II)
MDGHEAHRLSRRRFLASAGALGAAAWLGPGELLGGAAPPRPLPHPLPQGGDGPVQQIRRAAAGDPVQVQRLRGGVSVLSGNGGNVTALAGRDGVLLVDSGIVAPKVAAAVATLTRAPIRHVVNTHWHFDHTDGNEWHHARGAAVTAHENARRRMAARTRVDDWDFTFPPSPRGALPATLVAAERTLRPGGAEVVVRPYPPSHTDTDLAVHLVDADVLVLGDTWWNGIYPFIDYSTGGSIDGTIRAAEATLAMGSPTTVLVPGHGPVGGRADLAGYRDMLVELRERVAALKARGMTAAQAVAARPTAPYDAQWSGGPVDGAFMTRLAYKGV